MQPTDRSPEAEDAVIGGLLLDNRAVHELQGLRADHFASPFHARAFTTITSMIDNDEPADVLTVAERMKGDGVLVRLGSIAQGTPSAHVAAHGRLVIDKAQRRQIRSVLTEALNEAGTRPISDVLADTQAKLEGVSHDAMGVDQSFAAVLRAALSAVEDAGKRRQHGMIGAPTGLPAIDKRTGGVHGERLWVVAARPSLGKSAIVLQWCLPLRDHVAGNALSRDWHTGVRASVRGQRHCVRAR
jgi:replicative DNA helicase